MKIFQINDSDNESVGLILTNLPEKTVTEEWNDFYLNSDDVGADTFVDHLNERYPNVKSERFFIDAEINLSYEEKTN